MTADRADIDGDQCGRVKQSIVQTLMIALSVIEVHILIPISSIREKCGTPGILGTASGYGSMRDL